MDAILIGSFNKSMSVGGMFTASIIWPRQGTYLSWEEKSTAKHQKLHLGITFCWKEDKTQPADLHCPSSCEFPYSRQQLAVNGSLSTELPPSSVHTALSACTHSVPACKYMGRVPRNFTQSSSSKYAEPDSLLVLERMDSLGIKILLFCFAHTSKIWQDVPLIKVVLLHHSVLQDTQSYVVGKWAMIWSSFNFLSNFCYNRSVFFCLLKKWLMHLWS